MPSTESRWVWKPLLAWLAVGIAVAVLLELTLNDVLGLSLRGTSERGWWYLAPSSPSTTIATVRPKRTPGTLSYRC